MTGAPRLDDAMRETWSEWREVLVSERPWTDPPFGSGGILRAHPEGVNESPSRPPRRMVDRG